MNNRGYDELEQDHFSKQVGKCSISCIEVLHKTGECHFSKQVEKCSTHRTEPHGTTISNTLTSVSWHETTNLTLCFILISDFNITSSKS